MFSYFANELFRTMVDELPEDVVEVAVDFHHPTPEVRVIRRSGELCALDRKWFVPPTEALPELVLFALLVHVAIGCFGKPEAELARMLKLAYDNQGPWRLATLDAIRLRGVPAPDSM